jgi:hypothetical protein
MNRLMPLALYCLLLSQCSSAQDLFVRNHAFQGEMTGLGSDLFVEAVVLTKMLGKGSSQDGDTLILLKDSEGNVEPSGVIRGVEFEGELLPFQLSSSGKVLVALEPALARLGAKLKVDSVLGVLDVYLDDTLEKKSPEELAADSGSSESNGETAEARAVPREDDSLTRGWIREKDKETGLYGYKDTDTFYQGTTTKGRWHIKPKFFACDRSFRHGLAGAKTKPVKKKKSGYEDQDYVKTTWKTVNGVRTEVVDSKVITKKEQVSYTVTVGGKWGFIDIKGRWVIPAVYDSIGSFKKSGNIYYAVVMVGAEQFTINHLGQRIQVP